MERRVVVFMVLALAIWYGWLLAFPPEIPPQDPSPRPEPVEVVPAAPVPPPAPRAPREQQPLALCDSRATWSSDGGLSDLQLTRFNAPYQVTALHAWALGGFGAWRPYGDPPGPARVLSPRAEVFTPGAGALDTAPAALVGTAERASGSSSGLEIEHSLKPVDSRPCYAELTVTWRNPGSQAWSGPVWLSAHDVLSEPSGGMFVRYDTTPAASAWIDGSVHTLSGYPGLEKPAPIEGPAGWFGIGDRYFAVLAAPTAAHGRIVQTRRGELSGLHWVVDAEIAPGGSHTETLRVFVGPKDLEVLQDVHETLADAVELGWFSFFARPLLWMLKLFHHAVGDWGLAIILLTFTVKIVFFPLTQSAFRSGQAMQAIQPALQEIKEKYADNQEELNRRTMELFRDNKVNPVGGCLPMILQIPVWVALYNVLLSSVELYQSEFLYLRDLSSVDPYFVLPVVVTALILVQQQFTPMGNMDPAQARMMKFMPLIFGIFFFTLPSGLMVYILVNTVLSVLQQWFIKRSFPSPAQTAAASV